MRLGTFTLLCAALTTVLGLANATPLSQPTPTSLRPNPTSQSLHPTQILPRQAVPGESTGFYSTYTPPQPLATSISDRQKWFRYRAQAAVNMGGWMVSERWLDPSKFDCTGDTGTTGGEFMLARADGCKKEDLEHSWSVFVTQDHLRQLSDRGINTLRLPIGFWTVGKDNCHCEQSEIWDQMDKYENAWGYVMQLLQWAKELDLGVLIDFHAAQGGQNTWEHSGQVGSSGFINNPTNTAATQQVIKWVVNQVKDMDHVIGIELLNEATEDVTLLDGWYSQTAQEIQAIAGEKYPIYIWAGFRNEGAYWANWIQDKGRKEKFFVLDWHLYYLWGEFANGVAIDVINSNIGQDLAFLRSMGTNCIIGEWACALPDNIPSDAATQERFCDNQMAAWTDGAIGGWHYWNFRTEGDGFTAWDFLRGSEQQYGCLISPANGAPTFDTSSIPGGSPGFSHDDGSSLAKRSPIHQQVKRARYADDHPGASTIWAIGCDVANQFASSGHTLGFPSQWIREHALGHEDFSEEEYADHFINGLRSCQR